MSKTNIKINRISWNRLGHIWKGIAESYPFGIPPDVATRLFKQAERHLLGMKGLPRSMGETFDRRSDITGLALDVGMSPETVARASLLAWGKKWRDKLCAEAPQGFQKLEPMNEPKSSKN